MEDLTLTLTLLLLGAAFMAGFVDSIAGGGGLITVPALLLAGLSPVEALGTNKLQGLFGSSSATLAYARKGHVDLKAQRVAFLAPGGARLEFGTIGHLDRDHVVIGVTCGLHDKRPSSIGTVPTGPAVMGKARA